MTTSKLSPAPLVALLAVSLLGALTPSPAAAQVTFEDISPDFTDTWNVDPDRASGGRTNGIVVDPTNGNIMYAATEWGGLYKSTDAGRTWGRLTGHLPVVTWDVAVDPSTPQRVYATSYFDGRANPLSGIQVSTDGGAIWTRPASATPPAGFCSNGNDRTEPSAFGISIDPSTPSTVYVGTACGVAKSTNSGGTWTFIDPTPGGGADRVTDVVALGGNVVHACGDDGHLRSDDGGATWVQGTGISSGRCTLAVSPDEDYVLLAVVGVSIFETTDGNAAGGATWTQTRTNPTPQGRVPFVATNQRSDAGGDNVFDLWFGDVSLFRATCTTPPTPAPGGAPRCGTGETPAWAGPFTRQVGGHDDMGSIVFDPSVVTDACPILMSSDGGIYYNNDTSADCHNPNWAEPDVTPHALWPWSMNGNERPGAEEDLYFGLQDNGLFASVDVNDQDPSWHNELCCDGFDATGDDSGGLFSVCCFGGGGRSTVVFRTERGFLNAAQIPNYPAGGLQPAFDYPDSFATYGDGTYVMVTRDCNVGGGGCTGSDGGVFITSNIDAGAITWTELGDATEPPTTTICGVYPSVAGDGTPTFYTMSGSCNSRSTSDRVFRFTGTNPLGAWTEITLPSGGFGVFAVHPTDPNRVIASGLSSSGAAMFSSTDGGANWTPMPGLDALMDGGGDFLIRSLVGPTSATGFSGYWQPSLVAFDRNSDRILAGGQDSGLFLSQDDGATWTLISDPRTSDVSGVPHLPRPRFAHFDGTDPNRVFVASQGGGIWRLTLSESLFSDGFESGDTGAWTVSFP
ncbi:MAG: hypothetical protein AAGM22_07040 [Acidobacteriota bacterium]